MLCDYVSLVIVTTLSLSLFLTLFRTRCTSYALFLFLCVCNVSLFLIERNLNLLKKVNTIFRFPLHTPCNVAKFQSPIGFSCRRSVYIVSITYVDMYVCTYESTVYIWTCMYICYVLVFLQIPCLCVCNCLGRDRIGSVNWIKLKNFPCQNMFVCLSCLCMYTHMVVCVRACMMALNQWGVNNSRKAGILMCIAIIFDCVLNICF